MIPLEIGGGSSEALAIRRRAAEANPNAAHPWVRYAQELARAGRTDEADQAFRTAIAAEPNDNWAFGEWVRFLATTENAKAVLSTYLAGVEERWDDPGKWPAIGHALERIDRYEEAANAFALAMKYADTPARRNAATSNIIGVLQHLGRSDEAVDIVLSQVDLHPEETSLRVTGSVMLELLGRTGEAAALLRGTTVSKGERAGRFFRFGLEHQQAGRAAEAEAAYRAAIRLKPNAAAMSYCNLGQLLLRTSGRGPEGLELLRRGHEIGSARPDWPFESAKWVAEAEADAKWEAIIAGDTEPSGPAATTEAANHALVVKSQPLAAARLFERAFDALPPDQREHLYNAACAALRCSAGVADAADLAAAARDRWRDQALDWLRADYVRLRANAPPGGDGQANDVARELRHWRAEPDLAAVRGDALADLPEDERTAWTRLWDDHAALLRIAAGPATAPKP